MLDKERTACFTGHRDIPDKDIAVVRERTRIVIESLINKGVVYFGNGSARGFDLICCSLIIELKQKYPQIKLILVLPCRNQTEKWTNQADIAIYNEVLKKADKVRCLAEKHYKGCEFARNRHLIDNSGYCICYLTSDNGGTAYTVDYAKRNDLKIYNIAEDI